MIYETLKRLINLKTETDQPKEKASTHTISATASLEILSHPNYNLPINEIRAKEYAHLQNNVYLDNAGLPPCAKSVIEKSSALLLHTMYANPHSQSQVSQLTENIVQLSRLQILNLFNLPALQFEVVYTQNSTHAIKLVGEGFSDTFDGGFDYWWNLDSHTSIVGLRELCRGEKHSFKSPADLPTSSLHKPRLVSWTGQSNFNGKRYPIEDWNKQFKKTLNTYTLVDLSSLAATSPPDLANCKSVPDFMCLSLYKIFGYPNLGCLIVKKHAGDEVFMGKRYFGGGTVDAVADEDNYVQRRTSLAARLEEGTLPIYSIIQLSVAIDTFFDLYRSFESVSRHVSLLTSYAMGKLSSMAHDNGQQMVELLSAPRQGPIVTFCLLGRDASRLGFYDFEKHVSARGVSLRTGALCNIGATSNALQLTLGDIKKGYSVGQRCGDGQDSINGKIRGVIRISFGPMSTVQDIDYLCGCIQDFFAESFVTGNSNIKHADLTVKSISVYPIKSCHGFEVPANKPWKITKGGLEFDRMFCLFDPTSKSPMLLKNHPLMTGIRPKIDPIARVMTLEHEGESVEISLDSDLSKQHKTLELVNRGTAYECIVDENIVALLQKIVKVPCFVARLKHESGNMHNKSDFLVLSNSSLQYLQNYNDKAQTDGSPSRFRGNIIVQGADLKPFEEDNWKFITIQDLVMRNVELCERCHMITIDSETGKRDATHFVNLSKFRKLGGKVLFGINCDIDGDKCSTEDITIHVGDRVGVY